MGDALEGGRAPEFILILGGPEQVPFALQSFLHNVASVGRVAPERIEELQAYVDKVLRLERASTPTVDREVLFFSTDDGVKDPTYFSREYMVKPLAESVANLPGYRVEVLQRDEATKSKLAGALRAAAAPPLRRDLHDGRVRSLEHAGPTAVSTSAGSTRSWWC